jgi:hypothetical protein
VTGKMTIDISGSKEGFPLVADDVKVTIMP